MLVDVARSLFTVLLDSDSVLLVYLLVLVLKLESRVLISDAYVDFVCVCVCLCLRSAADLPVVTSLVGLTVSYLPANGKIVAMLTACLDSPTPT